MVDRIAVGLDVHARSVVGCGVNEATGEVFEARLGASPGEVVAWVQHLPGRASVAYEAGPTGFGLARVFEAAGVDCVVAAPSKLLPVPGSRVKTDRNDARHLAELVAAGLVTPVRVPTITEEAARDLVRARDDARGDAMRARHRISKLLLRHGIVWDKGTWTKQHLAWLAGLHFDDPVTQMVFDNDLAAVLDAIRRRDWLDTQIAELIPGSPWEPVVTALGCLRGVSTLTGFGLAVEIGDWARFTGSTIGAFVGLVPCEHSSGGSRCQGGVTKTGNTHARRLLVEAAWQHRSRYEPGHSPHLNQRWAKASPALIQRGDQANRRLHHEWVKFDTRGKKPAVANAAIARQLAGFCWSIAMMVS